LQSWDLRIIGLAKNKRVLEMPAPVENNQT